MSAVSRWLGTTLVVFGIAILVTVGGLYGYGAYERYRFEQEMLASNLAERQLGSVRDVEPPTASPIPELTATPVLPLTTDTHHSGTSTAVPTSTVPPATPTPIPTAPPTRIVASSIDLDSPIVEAKIQNHEWQVPKFVAGHLEGTAYPGQGSNVVLSGHVQSISSGNVFANLGGIQNGAHIRIDTEFRSIDYIVREIKTVRNDDLSVIAASPGERLTLITCTGTWNPFERDFSHRIIVVAEPEPTPTSSGGENQEQPGSPEL